MESVRFAYLVYLDSAWIMFLYPLPFKSLALPYLALPYLVLPSFSFRWFGEFV